MRALRAVAAAAVALAIAGCGPTDQRSARLYQLADGALSPLEGPSRIAARPSRPWTVQERVADMALADGALWLAINGRGIASFAPADRPKLSTFYDSLLFEHRTITTLLPTDGRLLVHVYFNAMLNTVTAAELRARRISLLLFSPGAQDPDYSIIVPPIQAANREWEAVGVAPVSPRELLLEWKLSGEETRFAWTWYQLDRREQSPATREVYRNALAYRPARGPAEAPAVRRAVDAAAAALGEPGPDASIVFPVRDRASPLKSSLRLGVGEQFATVPVFVDGAEATLLLPDGRVLLVSPGAGPREVGLPRLPPGFRYTDVVRLEDWLVLPWEQSEFTDVGAAGLATLRLPERSALDIERP